MTIGYEGLDTEQFIQLLKSEEVQTVVDIRQLPLSRKRGFSKASLSAMVEASGMRYVHMRALGTPKDIRNDYHKSHDVVAFAARYKSYLETQSEAVADLAELASKERCCLLCVESDPNHCHRLFVAGRVASLMNSEFTIHHLIG